MFAKNCWFMATEVENVTSTSPLAVKVAGEEIVLYRDTQNKIVAMADLCPHRLAPMSLGRIEGDDLRCMYHGLKFGSDGACKEVPGQEFVPEVFCIKKYAVSEGPEWVWVWIGDQAKADEALLPDQYLHDPKKFKVKKGSLEFMASYELFNDNTCDLSHVAYVHEATFGQLGNDEWSQKKPTITLHDRHVQVDRWMLGINIPQVPGQKVDFWSTFKHVLPGVFMIDIQAHPAGVAEKSNYEAPPEDNRPLFHSGSIQTARPLTETTSMFHYSIVAPHWHDDAVLENEFKFAISGFTEDKAMCEAQQRAILAHPEQKLRMTSHDKAGAHIRKLVRATHKEPAE